MLIKSIFLAGFLMISAGFAQAAGTDATVDCNPDGTPVSGGTVCIQIGGSSAAKNMGAQFALEFLDSTQPIFHYTGAAMTVTTPTGAQYVFASGDLNLWTGTLLPVAGGPSPAVIRYSPTHSMDGFAKLECQDISNASQLKISPGTYYDNTTPGYCGGTNNAANLKTAIPIANVDSQIPVLDFSSASCTGSPVAKSGTTVGGTVVNYTEYTGCTNSRMMGETMGASDVDAASFHQKGPSTWSVLPLDITALTVGNSFFIPFQFALSNTVQYTNPKTGLAATPVLSRDQAIALFGNTVPNWNLLPGYDGNSGQPFLCLRSVGSGTKGAINNTILKGTGGILGEAFLGANVAFNFTTGDMKTCITSHANSIGYMNADSLPAAGMTGVILDGALPKGNPNYTDAKATIRDGVYPFVTQEKLAYRTSADPSIDGGLLTGPQHTFMSAFITNSTNNTYLSKFGAGAFWVAPSDMCASKASDGATFKPISPAPAGCPAK